MKYQEQEKMCACVGRSTVSNATVASVPAGAAPTMLGITYLRMTFGPTSTLKAEVLWTLITVAKHQSYKSNDGIQLQAKLLNSHCVLGLLANCTIFQLFPISR